MKKGLFLTISLSIILLVLISCSSYSVIAQQNGDGFSIELDSSLVTVNKGEFFDIRSSLSYNGTESSVNIVVAVNIINRIDGEIVDPEDWSSQRTQYVDGLVPGDHLTLNWTIHAIWEGTYLLYFSVITRDTPSPNSNTIAIPLNVNKYSVINPRGVINVSVTLSSILLIMTVGLRIYRKRQLSV